MQEFVKDLDALMHQIKPDRVLNPVLIILHCLTSVKGRINVDAIYLCTKLRLQRLERQQVITMDQNIVEDVAAT